VGTGATGFDPRVELAWAMESPLLSGVGAEINAAFDKSYCNGGGSPSSAGAAYLAVRRASTCATGVGPIATRNGCRAVDDFFYLQTNGCYDENAGLSGGEVKLYGLGSADVESTLTYSRYSCDTSERAPIYRYVSRIYYVNQSNQLVRLFLDSLESGGHGYVQEILVDGVEDLQFDWFIDDTGNGSYDRKLPDLPAADAANVIGAKIWLKVQSPQDSGPSSMQSRIVELPNRVGRRR
jgi:type IV pilus assembly protein PilW